MKSMRPRKFTHWDRGRAVTGSQGTGVRPSGKETGVYLGSDENPCSPPDKRMTTHRFLSRPDGSHTRGGRKARVDTGVEEWSGCPSVTPTPGRTMESLGT